MESLGQSLVAVQVDGRVVRLDGLKLSQAVRGVLGDGGEGEGGEALVSVVLRSSVRLEARPPGFDLVYCPRAWHDEAGGPVRLTKQFEEMQASYQFLTVAAASVCLEGVRNLLPCSPTSWMVLACGSTSGVVLYGWSRSEVGREKTE